MVLSRTDTEDLLAYLFAQYAHLSTPDYLIDDNALVTHMHTHSTD